MRITTFVRIANDVDIEIEADVELDNARDPITGRGEWLVTDGPWVNTGPRRRKSLAKRYHAAADRALVAAAEAYEPEEHDR